LLIAAMIVAPAATGIGATPALVEQHLSADGQPSRSVPGITDQIGELMSGLRSIAELGQSGRLLPPPVEE
jgi:hypothetical protein